MANEQVRGVLENAPIIEGSPAPDFELPALIGGVRKTFHLTDYRGKTVLLAFFPFNWHETTLRATGAFQAERARVLAANAETVTITVESIMNTTAWERAHGPFDFPLCSDFWPHGAVSRLYGVLRESGASEHAIVVVNSSGQVSFRKKYDQGKNPSLDDLFPLLGKV